MKKIFTSLSLAAVGLAGAVSANAQERDLDLEPRALMEENQVLTRKAISPSPYLGEPVSADSIPGIIWFGIAANGGTMLENDTFSIITPNVSMNDDGTIQIPGIIYDGLDREADTVWSRVYYYGSPAVMHTDSINTLLNIEFYVDSGASLFESMLYRRSELVEGQTYGWYAHMRPYPGWIGAQYVDLNQSNNWHYTPVIWNAGLSIKDLLKNTSYTPIDVYPNPATDKISFNVDVDASNKSIVVRVLDNLGREVYAKNHKDGNRNLSVDISKFAAGNYNLQVICDRAIFASKFIKN